MKVVFDFDGVVCKSQEVMMRLLSERTGEHYTIDDWYTYDYKESFPDCYGILGEIFKEDIYGNEDCLANEGVVELIHLIEKSGHYVEIVSACANSEVAQSNKRWLVRNGLGNTKFIPVYNGNKDNVECDVMIEDCMSNIENSIAENKIIISKPWNMFIEVEGVYRAHDMSGVGIILKDLCQL